MINIKFVLFSLGVAWFASLDVVARDTYDCIEAYTSGLEFDSTFRGKLEVTNDDGKPIKRSKLQITILSNGTAYLKGNQGTSTLIEVSGRQYLERTDSGNIIMWTFFSRNRDSRYRILVTQKSYEIFTIPMTFTSVYECR